MSTEAWRELIEDTRDRAGYFYVLIDPLAGCDDSDPLHVSGLQDTLGPQALTVVPRADLAHTPAACPHLVTLAEPHGQPDAALMDRTLDRAQFDAAYSKRYICGWLCSPEPPGTLAHRLAERCHIESASAQRFLPLFEPLRLELLAATSHEETSAWLGPVRQWICPTSAGDLTLLRGNASTLTPSSLSARVLTVQADVPRIAILLAAWRDATGRPLRYAPRQWHGDTLLPPDAAAAAWRQLRDARALGLASLDDQLVFALHRLTIHPRLDEHPAVRADITRAARGETTLADRFDTYTDALWSHVVTALSTQERY